VASLGHRYVSFEPLSFTHEVHTPDDRSLFAFQQGPEPRDGRLKLEGFPDSYFLAHPALAASLSSLIEEARNQQSQPSSAPTGDGTAHQAEQNTAGSKDEGGSNEAQHYLLPAAIVGAALLASVGFAAVVYGQRRKKRERPNAVVRLKIRPPPASVQIIVPW
jgi:hypothetical protein